MIKKYYESGKVAENYYAYERMHLFKEFAEPPKGFWYYFPYAIALPVDFVNIYLAVMMILGSETDIPALGGIIAGCVTYIIGWWIPHKAGEWLKDGVVRNLNLYKAAAWILIFFTTVIIICVTIVRINGGFGAGGEVSSSGSAFEMGNTGFEAGSQAIAIMLTGVMTLTFIISLYNEYKRCNYYRSLALSKALERSYEAEANADLHATLMEAKDELNAVNKATKLAEEHKESVIHTINAMAERAKEHVTTRLLVYLGNPDKTTHIIEPYAEQEGDE